MIILHQSLQVWFVRVKVNHSEWTPLKVVTDLREKKKAQKVHSTRVGWNVEVPISWGQNRNGSKVNGWKTAQRWRKTGQALTKRVVKVILRQFLLEKSTSKKYFNKNMRPFGGTLQNLRFCWVYSCYMQLSCHLLGGGDFLQKPKDAAHLPKLTNENQKHPQPSSQPSHLTNVSFSFKVWFIGSSWMFFFQKYRPKNTKKQRPLVGLNQLWSPLIHQSDVRAKKPTFCRRKDPFFLHT